MFPKKEARIPFTREGYDKIFTQRDTLLAERPDAVENLRKAREMGDLSENGYYKAARARLSFLDSRLRRLARLVRLGVVVASSGSGRVEIGSNVTITDGKTTHTYTIVGGYESDPSKNTISYISPIGKALMGKREKDVVEVGIPKGIVRYTVIKVT
ncbi:hypothetical protein A2Z00_04920 [Candidatus Gottesmanbacteria bacterium RBG_13_45_10]|uniref:Transcription elongation factor GreA n=1 Tax=Candidatus Gottesmanbacteria bacterium RBG_13_45_10 TaxID=1798370 RepID=A0A1F5ZHG3_9BACT|nr:MAG: hypothetical protein A2Z00_04920 [Candidatus Gottesmanbacteria bacterium RBG_13_45_10]